MGRNRAALSNHNSVYKVLKTTFLTDGKLELWSEWENELFQMISEDNFDPDTYRKNFLDFLAKKTVDAEARLRFANLKMKDEASFHKTFSEDEKDHSKVGKRKQLGLDIADRKVRLLYEAGKVLMLAQATADKAELRDDFMSADIQAELRSNPVQVTKFNFNAAHQNAVPGITVLLNVEIREFVAKQHAELLQKRKMLQKVQELLVRARNKLKDNLNLGELVAAKTLVSLYTKKLVRLQREINSLMGSVRPDVLAQNFKDKKIGYFSAKEIEERITEEETQSTAHQKQVDTLLPVLNSDDPRIARFAKLSQWTAQSEKIRKEASSIVNQQGTSWTGSLPTHWAELDAQIKAFNPPVIDKLISEDEKNSANAKLNSNVNAQRIHASNAAEWRKESTRTVPIEFEVIDENDRIVKLKDDKPSDPYQVATITMHAKNDSTAEARNAVTAEARSLLSAIALRVEEATALTAEYNARVQQQLLQKVKQKNDERTAQLKQKNEAKAAQIKHKQQAELNQAYQALETQRPASVPLAASPEPTTPNKTFRPIPSGDAGFALEQPPSPAMTSSPDRNGGAGPAGIDVNQQSYSGPNTPNSDAGFPPQRSRGASVSSSDSDRGSISPPPNSPGSGSASRIGSRLGSPQIGPNFQKPAPKKEEGGVANWFASAWNNTSTAFKFFTCFTGVGLIFWGIAGACSLAKGDDAPKAKLASPTVSPKASLRLPETPNGNGIGTVGMNQKMGGNNEKLRKGTYDEAIFKQAKEKLRTIVRDQPPRDKENPKIKLNHGIVRVNGERFKTIKRPELGNGYELAFSIENGKAYAKKDNNIFQLPNAVLDQLLKPLIEGEKSVAFEFEPKPFEIEGRLAIKTVKSAGENGPLAIRNDDEGNGQVYQLDRAGGVSFQIKGADKDILIKNKLASISALSSVSQNAVSKPMPIIRPENIDSKYSDPVRNGNNF